MFFFYKILFVYVFVVRNLLEMQRFTQLCNWFVDSIVKRSCLFYTASTRHERKIS
jgi:hypothetical protein